MERAGSLPRSRVRSYCCGFRSLAIRFFACFWVQDCMQYIFGDMEKTRVCVLAYKVKSAPAALCITVQRGRILYWVVYRLRYKPQLSPCLRSRTARSSPCTWPRWPLRREPAACGGRSPCPADPCPLRCTCGWPQQRPAGTRC